MEMKHRELLRKNTVYLVQNFDLPAHMTFLFEDGLLNDQEIEYLEVNQL